MYGLASYIASPSRRRLVFGVGLVRGSLSDARGTAVFALAAAVLIVSPVLFAGSLCRAFVGAMGE